MKVQALWAVQDSVHKYMLYVDVVSHDSGQIEVSLRVSEVHPCKYGMEENTATWWTYFSIDFGVPKLSFFTTTITLEFPLAHNILQNVIGQLQRALQSTGWAH